MPWEHTTLMLSSGIPCLWLKFRIRMLSACDSFCAKLSHWMPAGMGSSDPHKDELGFQGPTPKVCESKTVLTSQLNGCHLFCRAQRLNSCHAVRRRSSSDESPQTSVSRRSVLRAFPTSHKSHPRCTTCIAHHFIIAMLKWGSNSKGPAGSIVAHH